MSDYSRRAIEQVERDWTVLHRECLSFAVATGIVYGVSTCGVYAAKVIGSTEHAPVFYGPSLEDVKGKARHYARQFVLTSH